MNADRNNRMLWLMGLLFLIILGILWSGAISHQEAQREFILRSYADMEMHIVKAAARATKSWLDLRVKRQGASREDVEREIFKMFIEPIRLLDSGDAFIYNRNYVVFDKSSDFPDIYRGKNIKQIFDLQANRGAHHYSGLVHGVMNATEGKDWFVWRSEKGREFVAWTSVKLGRDTWTIGLSTPEREILAHSDFYRQQQIVMTGALIISFLVVGIFFLIRNVQTSDYRQIDLLVHANRRLNTEIEERRQVEMTMRLERDYTAEIVNASPNLICSIDNDGTTAFINRAGERVTGYRADELIGQNWWKIFFPDGQYAQVDLILEELKRGEVKDYEMVLTAKNGDERTIVWNSRRRFDRAGNVNGIMGFGIDVTERRKAEREKEELQEKLTRAKRMEALGLLAGGVAHDLNNILSGIVSYPEVLLMGEDLSPKLRRSIEIIQDSGNRAAKVVGDLITVARGVASSKEPVNLNDVVQTCFELPEYEKLKRAHPSIEVQTAFEEDLLNIYGSTLHLQKAVTNLLTNAMEAIGGHNGLIRIATSNRYLDKALKGYDDVHIGEYVVLTIADDGPGISPDDLGRIFEPFYSKKIMGRSGTGLGLTLVWNTVQEHDGYIDVSSGSEGTTFTLYFPVSRVKAPAKTAKVSPEAYRGSGEKVLVIDDEPMQREIACTMLRELGYEAHAVAGGLEAVDYLKRERADILVLDMIMDPGINGRETYEKIVEIRPGQKAVIASGYAETEEVKRAQDLGAGAFVRKPYLMETLGLAVRNELDRS
ncbi:MAG: PAS domain S-box protein [Deltaproteobacteria bacterium]|nr:PAS domain S-box protein [Deltaproteobacteria bacterium]